MTTLAFALSALFIGGTSAESREPSQEARQQLPTRSTGVYVVRPLDNGSYAVLQVVGSVGLRPALAGGEAGGTTEYLNIELSPPSGTGANRCHAVFGLLSPAEFGSVGAARKSIQDRTIACTIPGVHWLVPKWETEILGQAGAFSLTRADGTLNRRWYVIRRTHTQETDLVTCWTSRALLTAVTPTLQGGGDSRLRTLSRTGSQQAPTGSYVLRLDGAGSIRVLRIEATLFREVYREAGDRNTLFDTSESVDLVVVGPTFQQTFGDSAEAIAAIESGDLAAEEQVGVWLVPAKPTRAFLVYDQSGTTAKE